MKKALTSVSLLFTATLFSQVDIEPFSPGVPATYMGDFDFLTPGDDIPSSSTYTEQGDVSGPDNAWTCDDGTIVAGFAAGIGNWATGTCELGDELFLISPEMDFGTATLATNLTFRYIIDDGAHVGFPGFFGDVNLDVYYKTSAGGAWNLLSTYTTVDNTWHNVAVDLDGASDYSTYYLGFRMYGVAAGSFYTWGFMGLDEIVVEGTDGGGCSDSFFSFSLSQCFNYTVPSGDETYSISGTYMDTIPNSTGCDSIMTIDLTVVTPDVGLTLAGATLTADATGVTYQWVSCPSMAVIAGETNQSYSPGSDGDYAVIITDGACVDTSACQTVVTGGNNDNISDMFSIFPNPADASAKIVLENGADFRYLELTTLDGRVCRMAYTTGSTVIDLDLSEIPTGTYLIRLYSDQQGVRTKILVKK